jgi:hypothetical protein
VPVQFRAGSANGVPGLGFDYVNLAAVSRPMRAPNFERHPGRAVQSVIPILSWGLPGYAEQQPVVIVLQQPAPTFLVEPPSPAEAVVPAAPAATASVSTAPAVPLRELGQFILVRRDGQIVLAAGFSAVGGRLTYITSEGARRSFPLAELDTEVTRQMNDVNGTTLTLPD